MVVAKFEMDETKRKVSLRVDGHAGANAPGSDIICASATILAYTLAQNIKIAEERGELKYNPTIKLKDGDSIITVRCADDESYISTLSTYLVIQTGYQVLAYNYPQYVAVELFGGDEES